MPRQELEAALPLAELLHHASFTMSQEDIDKALLAATSGVST
jgi:hypothetical protein